MLVVALPFCVRHQLAGTAFVNQSQGTPTTKNTAIVVPPYSCLGLVLKTTLSQRPSGLAGDCALPA
jgi:hypothetical protein